MLVALCTVTTVSLNGFIVVDTGQGQVWNAVVRPSDTCPAVGSTTYLHQSYKYSVGHAYEPIKKSYHACQLPVNHMLILDDPSSEAPSQVQLALRNASPQIETNQEILDQKIEERYSTPQPKVGVTKLIVFDNFFCHLLWWSRLSQTHGLIWSSLHFSIEQ